MPPFEYAPFVNPYAASIGDLLLRGGDIAAHEAQAKGAAWAGAAQNIGNAVSGTIQQVTDPQRQLQAQQVDANKRGLAFTATVNHIVSTLTQQNPDGSRTLDRGKLQQAFAAANVPPAMQEQTFKSLDDVDTSITKFNTARTDHLADLAHSVLTNPHGVTPETLAMGVALAQANGMVTPDQVKPIADAVANGADLTGMLTQIRGLSEKYKDAEKPVILPKDATLVTPTGTTIAQGKAGGKTEAELAADAANAQSPTHEQSAAALRLMKGDPSLQSESDWQMNGKSVPVLFNPKTGVRSLTPGGPDVSAQLKKTPPASMTINPALMPTGDALDMAAKRYLATGELPAMGMGQAGAAARIAVMNAAAKIDPQASLAANKATYKADSANLTKLQTTEGTLSAFEKTAGKNLDQFLTLAAKIPDTGVPWLNTPVRLLSSQVVGDANMAAINAARDVALREIARVTNDPKLSGSLTDSARAEVMGLSKDNATLPQIIAVAKVLKQDMANVHAGVNEQIATVKAGLGGNPATATPAAPMIEAKDPQGNIHHAAAGTALPAGWTLVKP